MIHKNVTVMNSNSEIIRVEINYREDAKEAPIIVICHGFKGFKNWAFFPVIADTLAQSGYITLTFNFSRNGIGSDLQNFTELDMFEKNTYSHELEDLQCIIDAISTGTLGKIPLNIERIGLLGHSRGGGIAILHTKSDARIQTLVTWSAISTVERYSEDVINYWQDIGHIEIENKRTGQLMRIGIDLLNDIRKNKDNLNILAASEKIEIPSLIVHGQEDESVPVDEAQQIFDHLKTSNKELMLIENGTHTFGARHPMGSITPELETVFDLTENWFDRFL
jgi:dienelactone hydrolase